MMKSNGIDGLIVPMTLFCNFGAPGAIDYNAFYCKIGLFS